MDSQTPQQSSNTILNSRVSKNLDMEGKGEVRVMLKMVSSQKY